MLLLQYKPFLLFLGKFFLSYLVLTLIYQAYLHQFDERKSEVDAVTVSVAHQTAQILYLFDKQAHTEPNPTEPSVKLFYKNKYIARIVEGCNAISIMILFIAFVLAFTGKWKQTVLFVVFGLLLIHVLNIARITLLCMALYSYPEYEHILHDVLFPLAIYGTVFFLWVIWVNNYSTYAKISKK